MDTNKISIEKLNGSNYQTWKYEMELVLMKIWDVVNENASMNPTPAWTRKDGRARALIGLQVENREFVCITKPKTIESTNLIAGEEDDDSDDGYEYFSQCNVIIEGLDTNSMITLRGCVGINVALNSYLNMFRSCRPKFFVTIFFILNKHLIV